MFEKIKLWWSSLSTKRKFFIAAIVSTVWATLNIAVVFLVPYFVSGINPIFMMEYLSKTIKAGIGLNIRAEYVLFALFGWGWINIFIRLIIGGTIFTLIARGWRKLFPKKVQA